MSPVRVRGMPPWARWVTGFLVVAAVAALAVAVLTPSVREEFEAEVAKLRADGVPTTYAEFDGPDPPDDENGAADLDAAMAEVDRLVGPESKWTVLGPWDSNCTPEWPDTCTPAEMEALRTFLDGLRPAFERLETASSKRTLRWKRVLDANGMNSQSHVSPIQHAQRLLTARIQSGRTASECVDGAVVCLRLGQRIETASPVDAMVAVAVGAGGIGVLRREIERGSLMAIEARRRVDPELRWSAADRLPAIANADLVFACEVFGRYVRGELNVGAASPLDPRAILAPNGLIGRLFAGSPADALRTQHEVRSVPAGPYPARRDALERIVASAKPWARSIALIYPQILRHLARADTTLRLARVALAAKERRETTGRWPASLDEIRDEFPGGIPVDARTDAPFTYEVGEGVVRISASASVPGEATKTVAELREDGLVWEFPE